MTQAWTKIYSHDEFGSRTFGHVNDLVDKIKDGADVKVEYVRGAGTWMRELPAVTTVVDEDGGTPIVTGIVTDIPDTQTVTDGRIVDTPFIFEWQAFNTSGKRFQRNFNRETMTIVSDSTTELAMTWYIREGWQKVFENRSNGTTFSGSVSSLISALQQGKNLKVRYYVTSGLKDIVWYRTCPSAVFTSDTVSTLLTDIPDTNVDLTVGRSFDNPAAFEWHAYNTSSLRNKVKFNRETLNDISNTTDNLQIGWYVQNPCRCGFIWVIRDWFVRWPLRLIRS